MVLAQLVITVLMVLAAAALAHPGEGLAGGVDGIAVGLALLVLGTLGLPLTFRIVPHVVEAAAVAGGGAAVASKVRSGSARLLAAAPHPAARLASAAPAGRAAPSVARPTPPPAPTAAPGGTA